MKIKPYSFLVIAAIGLSAACDKASNTGGTASGSAASAPAAPEAPDPNIPEKTVAITGNDQMKFDVTTIEAKPGQKVTVTLTNVGTMPKLSMGHNFVLLSNDLDPTKFVEASMTHMASDFVAPELKGSVIANTKLLGPGESDTVSFAAPRAAGDYTYVCSFPGHFAIGMKGVLSVK